MIILQYHEIFFRLIAPRCPGMAAGGVSLRKSHDIVILSFCNIVKCQADMPAILKFVPIPLGNNGSKWTFLPIIMYSENSC